MKSKFLAVFFCCLIFFSLTGTIFVAAESNDDAAVKAHDFIGGIIAYKQSDSDIQAFINGKLTEDAGTNSEWYVLALSQYGNYDFISYKNALTEYLMENEMISATTRQKYALCLSAVGSTNSYISEVAENSIGEQGIMSWIFGLHLLNNGYKSELHSCESVVQKLCSMQLADGGWSIMGDYGDVDITAMTIQALAPYYSQNDNVKTAADNALFFLSGKQKETGDYASYGIDNPESTAQVLVALSSLGIDCSEDSRFIKNGNTLIDAMEKYRLPDGSFSHENGGTTNEIATVQVFYSMISYLRMTENKAPLYILDNADPEHAEKAQTEENGEAVKLSYKLWPVLIITAAGGVACIILLLLKKKSSKNFIVIILVTVAAIGFVLATDFRSADEYYSGDSIVKENAIGQVTMTIRCDTIVGRSDSEYVPQNGIILDVTEFDIEKGDTAYDILIEAAQKHAIQIENEGSKRMAYIAGINYIYEFDYGDLSGWVYHINGIAPSVGCGEYELSDGDVIEWHYTCDLGNDVK